MNIFYAYVYLDVSKPGKYDYGEYEFDYEPFYVGKGRDNRLLAQMVYAETTKINHHRFNRIRKLTKDGFTPQVIKVRENLSESESFTLEMDLISKIGRNDLGKGPLLNFSDGGAGGALYTPGPGEHWLEKMDPEEKEMWLEEHLRGKNYLS